MVRLAPLSPYAFCDTAAAAATLVFQPETSVMLPVPAFTSGMPTLRLPLDRSVRFLLRIRRDRLLVIGQDEVRRGGPERDIVVGNGAENERGKRIAVIGAVDNRACEHRQVSARRIAAGGTVAENIGVGTRTGKCQCVDDLDANIPRDRACDRSVIGAIADLGDVSAGIRCRHCQVVIGKDDDIASAGAAVADLRISHGVGVGERIL